jgi:phosphate transport system substrate-binding protein
MKRIIGWAGIPALMLLAGSAYGQALEVSGATTIQKRVIEPGADPLKSATGVDVKIQGVGTGKGMIALIEGKVPVAAAGESLEDAVRSAKKAAQEAGKTLAVPANLVYHKVAEDNIVFAVHPSNGVASLNKDQLRSILSGRAGNWKQFGGPDLPIKVYAPAQGQAVRAAVEKAILEGTGFSPASTEIRTALEQLKLTAGNPGAIAPYSEAVIKEGSERLKIVPGTVIERPLGFVTVGAPSPVAKKMIDYFQSPAGKKVIR